jgi:hypothetical protein
MVVTFPYAGVLVVLETRRELPELRVNFTRASVGSHSTAFEYLHTCLN